MPPALAIVSGYSTTDSDSPIRKKGASYRDLSGCPIRVAQHSPTLKRLGSGASRRLFVTSQCVSIRLGLVAIGRVEIKS